MIWNNFTQYESCWYFTFNFIFDNCVTCSLIYYVICYENAVYICLEVKCISIKMHTYFLISCLNDFKKCILVKYSVRYTVFSCISGFLLYFLPAIDIIIFDLVKTIKLIFFRFLFALFSLKINPPPKKSGEEQQEITITKHGWKEDCAFNIRSGMTSHMCIIYSMIMWNAWTEMLWSIIHNPIISSWSFM